MKALRRLALAAAGLALLAAVVLAVLLPRIVASDAVRSRIGSAAQTALGRELSYARLDVGWFPPALVVVAPVVAGDGPGAPPFAEAQKLSLRLALAPLLVRALVIDSLVVDDAVLRLRRSARGLELPRAGEGEADGAGQGAGKASEPASSALALRRLVLRDATILLEDHAVSPAVRWELRDVQAKLRGRSLEAPLRLQASFALASGGRVEVGGSAGLDGELDLELELDSVALAPLAPYLDSRARFAGSLSGSVAVEGPASSPTRIAARLLLSDGDVQLDEISLRGPLRVAADLAGGIKAPSGSFDLDATEAELVYGGAFRKPPGTSAKVTGRLVSGPAGALGVDDVKLLIHGLDATAKLRTGERGVLDLSAPAFDLTGWEALFPVLAGWELRGPVHSEGLAFARAPLDLRGRVRLDGVEARPPDGEFIALRGALVGAGDRIRSEGLELIAAEQVLRLAVDLSALDTPERRYQLHLETSDADVDRLLSAFAGRGYSMQGRLALAGDLGLRVGGAADPLEALAGRVRLEIRDGRVAAGKSLLGSVLAAITKPLGAIGGLALPGSDARHDDRFESASGTFDVAQGFARTQDLRIVQRTRSLELRGSIRLADLALDMVGGLVLPLPSPGSGAANAGGQRIPIAHVGGTLGDPRVEVTPQAVRKLASALSPAKLGRQLERVLDPSAAEDLVKGLGSLLGGSSPGGGLARPAVAGARGVARSTGGFPFKSTPSDGR